MDTEGKLKRRMRLLNDVKCDVSLHNGLSPANGMHGGIIDQLNVKMEQNKSHKYGHTHLWRTGGFSRDISNPVALVQISGVRCLVYGFSEIYYNLGTSGVLSSDI